MFSRLDNPTMGRLYEWFVVHGHICVCESCILDWINNYANSTNSMKFTSECHGCKQFHKTKDMNYLNKPKMTIDFMSALRSAVCLLVWLLAAWLVFNIITILARCIHVVSRGGGDVMWLEVGVYSNISQLTSCNIEARPQGCTHVSEDDVTSAHSTHLSCGQCIFLCMTSL